MLKSHKRLIAATFIFLALLFPYYHKNDVKFTSATHSQAFTEIIKCTDISDGYSCFLLHKPALVKEMRSSSPVVYNIFSSCLEMIEPSNDTKTLLQIQNCFHQANLVELESSSNYTFAITILILFQILQALYFHKKFDNFKFKWNDFEISLSQVIQAVEQLKLDFQFSINCIYGRLNKGGDINNFITELQGSYKYYAKELSKMKFFVYNMEFMVVKDDDIEVEMLPTPETSPVSAPEYPAAAPQYPATASQSNFVHNKLESINSIENSPKDSLSVKSRIPKASMAANLTPAPDLKYRDIKTTDEKGNKFKRLFIPNRGWVSRNAIKREIELYGLNSSIVYT